MLAALAPAPAAALDVKLWPFFRYARNDDRGELRWSALGPLIEYVRTPELQDLRIRPFLWLTRRLGSDPDERMEILTPIVSARRQGDDESLRFLLLSRHWTAPRAGAVQPTSSFTFFPFVFFRSDAAHGTHLGMLPFYLDLTDVFGYERVRTVLFPAYLELDEPRVERRFYGFPFVSTLGGTDGSGWRVWPFYGSTAVAGQERTRYVMWPFYVENERLVPEYGWEHRLLVLPVYAALDGEERTSRGYGVLAMWAPLWGVFRWDTSPDGHLDWSLLWGLVSRERGHLRPPWFIDRAPPTEDDDGG